MDEYILMVLLLLLLHTKTEGVQYGLKNMSHNPC